MPLGAEDLSEEALTSGVIASRASLELHISLGLGFCCSIEAKREMRSRIPNMRMASSTVNMMLNPRREHSRISA